MHRIQIRPLNSGAFLMGAGPCVVLPNRRQTDQSCCLVLAGLNFCISSIMTEQSGFMKSREWLCIFLYHDLVLCGTKNLCAIGARNLDKIVPARVATEAVGIDSWVFKVFCVQPYRETAMPRHN